MSHTRATTTRTDANSTTGTAGRSNSRDAGQVQRKTRTPSAPATPFIQKLSIGAVDDPLERQADEEAQRVMRMPDPGKSLDEDEMRMKTLVQRETLGDDEEKIRPKPLLQRDAGSAAPPPVTPEIASQVHGLRGRGQPMSPVDQSFFAPRMPDIDVSRVRVHSDSGAQQLARSVEARAFTFENNVVMGKGEYTPGTDSGRRLMAHELTHVAQQGAAPGVARKAKVLRAPEEIVLNPALDTRTPREKLITDARTDLLSSQNVYQEAAGKAIETIQQEISDAQVIKDLFIDIFLIAVIGKASSRLFAALKRKSAGFRTLAKSIAKAAVRNEAIASGITATVVKYGITNMEQEPVPEVITNTPSDFVRLMTLNYIQYSNALAKGLNSMTDEQIATINLTHNPSNEFFTLHEQSIRQSWQKFESQVLAVEKVELEGNLFSKTVFKRPMEIFDTTTGQKETALVAESWTLGLRPSPENRRWRFIRFIDSNFADNARKRSVAVGIEGVPAIDVLDRRLVVPLEKKKTFFARFRFLGRD